MNTKNILITGTRAPSSLEIARHFHAAGHRVVSAESLKYPLCKSSRSVSRSFQVQPPRQDPEGYIEGLEKIIREEKIDLLIPTCEEIYTIAKNRENLSCEVFCDTFEKLMELHDKWSFIEKAKSLGLAVPRTWRLESNEVLNFPLEVVLKPVFSRFGTQVHYLNSHEKLPSLEITKQFPWVAQERLRGPAYCTYSIVREGKIQAHAAYPVKICAGQGACIYFEAVEQKEIFTWIETFVDKIKFTGQIAFDFIQDASGTFYPIECNPRTTSGVHLFTHLDKAMLQFNEKVEEPKKGTKKMLLLAMLGYGRMKWAKDVLFDLRDPWPFFTQFATFFNIAWIARKTGKSLLEASTHDIEWNGGL